MPSKPSKDQLKRTYGIKDDDFEILVQPEVPKTDQRVAAVERVEDWFGIKAFLLRSKAGQVLAIVFIGYALLTAPVTISETVEKAEAGWKAYASFVEPLGDLPEQSFPTSSIYHHKALLNNSNISPIAVTYGAGTGFFDVNSMV